MYERKRTVSYLVQWRGQPREDATWETQASLTLKCPRLVNDFERKWRAQLVDRGSFIQVEGRKFRLLNKKILSLIDMSRGTNQTSVLFVCQVHWRYFVIRSELRMQLRVSVRGGTSSCVVPYSPYQSMNSTAHTYVTLNCSVHLSPDRPTTYIQLP